MAVTCYKGSLEIHKVPGLQAFLATSYSITAVTTTLLNFVVLLAIWKTPSLHKPSLVLLASLAFSDFLYGMVVMPIVVSSNVLLLNQSQDFCKIWNIARAFGHLLGGVSLYTLTLISIDRFLAIKLKLSYRVVFTTRRCIIALLVGWLGGALLVGISYQVSLMSSYFVVIGMFMFVFTITTSYAMAYYNLKKITSVVVAPSNTNEPNATSNFSAVRYKRSFNAMLLILSMTIVFYLPIACALSLERLLKGEWIQQFTRVGELIVALNCTCNPILYLWCIKELREAVKGVMRGIF
jgi:hypothetical protein